MAGQKFDRLNGGRLIDLRGELDRPLQGDLEKSQKPTLDTFRYKDYVAMFQGKDKPLDGLELVRVIARIEQERFNLETLGNAFTPLIVNIGTSPTLILPPNKSPRGYLFLNPNQTVTGVTTDTNLFTPLVRGAATYTSAALNVQTFRTSRFFLNITVAPATLQVNLQTQDPQTGNWATAQTDIFAGVIAPGTYYADTGEVGTDDFNRIQVVQTGAGANWSLTQVNKEAYGSTVAPPGVFLGNANVNTSVGYPILGGQEKRFFLMDNTPLYGVALAATTLRVFQLQ